MNPREKYKTEFQKQRINDRKKEKKRLFWIKLRWLLFGNPN